MSKPTTEDVRGEVLKEEKQLRQEIHMRVMSGITGDRFLDMLAGMHLQACKLLQFIDGKEEDGS